MCLMCYVSTMWIIFLLEVFLISFTFCEQGKPRFIKPSIVPVQFLYWPASSDIKFGCEAIGERPISYRWLKNGKSFTSRTLDPKINTTRWFLRIKIAVFSDNGLYTCIVSNRLGNISRSINFNVVENHRIRPILSVDYPKNKTVKRGSNTTFECRELVSTILPDYRWLKWNQFPKNYPTIQLNDTPPVYINSSDYMLIDPKQYEPFTVKDRYFQLFYGGRVILENVSKEDAGLYTCLVTNQMGRTWKSAFLIIDETENPVIHYEGSAGQTGNDNQWEKLIIVIIVAVCIVFFCSILAFYLIFVRSQRKQKSDGINQSEHRYPSWRVWEFTNSTSSSTSNSPINPLLGERNISISYKRNHSNLSQVSEVVLPCDDKWEIHRESILLLEVIGEGAFGKVLKAEAFNISRLKTSKSIVAVKTLKDDATKVELTDLVSEMNVMKRIGRHKNIITLIGCCTQNEPLLVVVEYAPYGSLREYLIRNRCQNRQGKINPMIEGEEKLTLKDFISFSYQIAKGMEYLSSRKCIHRDLAARNVLVGEEKVMKIADFGLARDIHEIDYYRKTTDGRLPVKWMALEALFDRIYTSQSDVWSFGIIVWEIVTFGGTPYPSIPLEKLFELLQTGYRMERPVNCPQDLYDILIRCWIEEPDTRPTFTDIVRELDTMLSNMTNEEYLDLEPLICPMKPHATANCENSIPCEKIGSNESLGSSVFESGIQQPVMYEDDKNARTTTDVLFS